MNVICFSTYVNENTIITYLENNGYEVKPLGYYLKKYYGYKTIKEASESLNLSISVIYKKVGYDKQHKLEFFDSLDKYVEYMKGGSSRIWWHRTSSGKYGLGSTYYPLEGSGKGFRNFLIDEIFKSKMSKTLMENLTIQNK